MTTGSARFVLCLTNEDFPVSLEPRKVYRAIHDSEAEAKGLVRVIDESGEDYLYPASLFASVEVPEGAEAALLGSE